MYIENGKLVKVYDHDIINGTIVIPPEVTIIGRSAFKDLLSIEHITIPDTVTNIKEEVFSGCGNLKKITLPKKLPEISYRMFENCTSLEEIILPESLELIDTLAFCNCSSLKKIKLPKMIKDIRSYIFEDCTSLEEVQLPETMKSVGSKIFKGCPNLKRVLYKEQSMKVSQAFLEVFQPDSLFFLNYTQEHKESLPQISIVYQATNVDEIDNFYQHRGLWRDILNEYKNKFPDFFEQKDLSLTKRSISALYSISTALGLFQDGKDFAGANSLRRKIVKDLKTSEKLSEEKIDQVESLLEQSLTNSSNIAKWFIKVYILKIEPEQLFNLFHNLNTQKHGFNQDFADFFIKYYSGKSFLDAQKETKDGTIDVNLICEAYNRWNEIESAYPNRTKLLSDRATGSKNNYITVDNVVNTLNMIHYKNVLPGNEELARLCSKYGYTQEKFDKLQDIWEVSKTIQQEDKIIQIEEDTAEKGIKFELMSNQDINTLFIGEITNCCQVVDDNGEPCMKYGATKLNSGFISFTFQDQIVGQAWIWYNPETKTICLDSIEIPANWKKKLKENEKARESFFDCLTRLSSNIKQSMLAQGIKIKDVTIGKGSGFFGYILDNYYNNNLIQGDISSLPKDYALEYPEKKRYSDAKESQFRIPGTELIEQSNFSLNIG